MDNPWEEAGPEWVYLARLTSLQSIELQFDALCINLRRLGNRPVTKIDSLQALRNTQGMYVPSDLTRFTFEKLREMIGQDSDDFDLIYEAYEGARPRHGVAIPDASSFRRLLSAILSLGLPVPASVTHPHEVPPVLRFFAIPKDNSAASAVQTLVPHTRGVDTSGSFSRGHRTLPHAPSPEVNEPGSSHRAQSGSRHRNYPNVNVQENTPSFQQNIPIRQEDTTVVEDTPMTYGDTPPDPNRPSTSRGQRPSLMSLDEIESQSQARDSFLGAPKEPPREPLTFEARVNEDYDYGLSSHDDDVHDEDVHNLYADISGNPRHKRDPENPDHEYQPPYSTISLPPHQTYPTGFIFSQRRKLLHYLADKPGLGKTFAALEAMVRISLLVSNDMTIRREAANLAFLQQRPLHIHDKAHPTFGINQSCQANTLQKWGFICSCDKRSPTSKVMETRSFGRGYMMVVVPLHLVDQWVKQIKRFIRSDVRLPHNQRPFEIVNVHEGKDYGENMKNFIKTKREENGLGTFCIVPTTSTVIKSRDWLRDDQVGPLEPQPSMVCMDEVQNIASTDHDAVELVRLLIERSRNPVHVLCLGGSPWRNGPADFDVIEKIALDSYSWSGWFGKEEYDDYEKQLKSARANLNESAKQVRQMDIIGRGQRGNVRDEEKTEAHNILTWHDQRLRRYASQIPLLQRKDGSMYLGYRIPQSSGKAEIQIVRCDSVLTDAQKRVANGYKEFLRLCHRKRVRDWSRKEESVRGPRPKIRDFLFSLDAIGTNSSRIDVSLIGFAPGLTEEVLGRSNMPGSQFRSDEANRVFRRTTITSQREAVRQSPFWAMAQSAFDTVDVRTGQTVLHPKIIFICKTIDEMLRDREPHVKGSLYLGVLPKKMIIVTPHPFQSALITAYLYQRYPQHAFTFVGALNEPNKERPALTAPFERPTDRPSPEDGRSSDPIALISTYSIIGTGLNLTRANYLIATSPLSSKAYETQQFGRIDRKGQYAGTLHCYVLLDNGNPVDVTTFHRMQRRTALTVPPDEMGTGLDFLLQDIDEEDERAPEYSDDEMGE